MFRAWKARRLLPVERLRDSPVPFVASYEVRTGWQLPHGFALASYSGLLMCQVIHDLGESSGEAGPDHVVTHWTSQAHFVSNRVALEHALSLHRAVAAGPQRAVVLPKRSRALLIYSGLVTVLAAAITLLGYSKSLHEHFVTMGATPNVQISSPGKHILIQGETYDFQVVFKNLRRFATSAINILDPVMDGDGSELEVDGYQLERFPSVAPGQIETVHYVITPQVPGHYGFTVRCTAEAGWFGGSREFAHSFELEVWKPLDVSALRLLPAPKPRRAFVRCVVAVGRDHGDGLQGEAFLDEAGVEIRFLHTAGVTRWRKIPVEKPKKIEWTWPKVRARERIECTLELASQADLSQEDWERVAEEVSLTVF